MATQRIYSAEEAVTKLHQLPPTAQDFIYSKEMGDILTQIGEKYALHLDQLGNLEHETVALMLGFTEPADFTACIAESLALPTEKAAAVVKEVNDLLLTKVRKDMEAATPSEPPQIIAENNPLNPSSIQKELLAPLPTSVDTMLSAPTLETLPQKETIQQELTPPIQTPASTSTQNYKVDPYREPIE